MWRYLLAIAGLIMINGGLVIYGPHYKPSNMDGKLLIESNNAPHLTQNIKSNLHLVKAKSAVEVSTSLIAEKQHWQLQVGLPQHTALIGSTTSPTIDGGIINAADGIPVEAVSHKTYAPATTIPTKMNQSQKPINQVKQTSPDIHFNDNWATSKRVDTALSKAAKNGELPNVLQQAKQMSLPSSVALIPLVESDYSTNAISSKGAAGAWQIMPQTAKAMGLSEAERYNFEASTKGALTFLSQLHHEFGSWDLAFAAYNAGPSRVRRAIQSNPMATSLDELNLPNETKNYVHQLKAMTEYVDAVGD